MLTIRIENAPKWRNGEPGTVFSSPEAIVRCIGAAKWVFGCLMLICQHTYGVRTYCTEYGVRTAYTRPMGICDACLYSGRARSWQPAGKTNAGAGRRPGRHLRKRGGATAHPHPSLHPLCQYSGLRVPAFTLLPILSPPPDWSIPPMAGLSLDSVDLPAAPVDWPPVRCRCRRCRGATTDDKAPPAPHIHPSTHLIFLRCVCALLLSPLLRQDITCQ